MEHITHLIGTGGIGAGLFLALDGNADIGRNETRMGHRLEQRDYCKQHIILHYLAVLLREEAAPPRILPIGAVGNDDFGQVLRQEMAAVGMDLTWVRTLPDAATLFSICWLFPDSSGGNFTENRSASSRVTPEDVAVAEPLLAEHGPQCLVLAAPEVPLASRLHLLRLGRRHGAFTVASFVSGELREHDLRPVLAELDLLALNLDEAAALVRVPAATPAPEIIEAAAALVAATQPQLRLWLTHGRHGAWGLHEGGRDFLPALTVDVVNTAGAGDASLAGTVYGLLKGLPFAAPGQPSAARLGRLVAAMSVTSADTIHWGLNRQSLAAFARAHGEAELVARW